MVDQSSLAPQIAQARAAGYSDDDIVNHISQAVPEFKRAKEAGYSSAEILAHVGTAKGKTTAGKLPDVNVSEGDQKPDDHGLARRQAMTPVEKAISPITEWPRHTREMSTEATDQFSRGVGQIGEGLNAAEAYSLKGLGTFAKGVGNVGLGALGAIMAPVSGAYRSVVGQPIEDVTGIPREYSEFTAQLATPGLGFGRLPQAPGVIPKGPMIRPPEEVPRPVVAEAAGRLNEIPGIQADVPRAVTGGRAEQATGQYLSNVPYAGAPISEAIHTKLPQQLEQARNAVAAEHGAGTGTNVANRVRTTLEEQAAAETKAATEAAARADAEATANWQRANAEREAAIAQREQQSTQRAQEAVGPELHPQDMGDFVINRTRVAHDAAEARKNALYDSARDIEARISDGAISRLHGFVERSLESAGIHTQEISGIRASRDMLRLLDRFSEAARARAELAPVGQSMSEVEQLRKNMNLAYGTFENPSDKRIAKHIIDALDDWQVRATRDNLMPGSDPRAHKAMLDARAANRDLMQRYGYNQRDDADKLINKIVRGEEDQHAGSVGLSNALTGGGDKAAPLHRRLMAATGNDPDVAQAIRSGTWNKLTRDAEGAPLPAETVRRNVITHLHGKGRDVAERVFDNSQRALMRAHADTVRETAAERHAAQAQARASNAPKPTKVEPGDVQKLADQVIGGKTSDEALFNTLHGYAKKGGDVKALARVMGQLPVEMRGDLAGAFVREIGVAPGTKQFSLDHFANQWATLTPQAKAVMFGNAGPHVTALNDIATIARELKVVKGRFGNPSGTAQNTLFSLLVGALGTQSPKAAASIVAGGVAGRMLAKTLANPAGASSVLKYARAVERAEREASPAHMAAVKMTQRNLANTARTLGVLDK
jgi:hypothetical protein